MIKELVMEGMRKGHCGGKWAWWRAQKWMRLRREMALVVE